MGTTHVCHFPWSIGDTAAREGSGHNDENNCKSFIENTRGCKTRCREQFSMDHDTFHHAQADLLSHQDLDMALTGAMMALTNSNDHIQDGRHITEERKRPHTMYMHNGYRVCQQTFRFLYGVGKDKVTAIKNHYITNGLCVRFHGNAGKLPPNVTP